MRNEGGVGRLGGVADLGVEAQPERGTVAAEVELEAAAATKTWREDHPIKAGPRIDREGLGAGTGEGAGRIVAEGRPRPGTRDHQDDLNLTRSPGHQIRAEIDQDVMQGGVRFMVPGGTGREAGAVIGAETDRETRASPGIIEGIIATR